jgi:hypothetical protein
VSGRYKLLDGGANWIKHRFLFALNNAEIYLSLRHVFDRKLISYFWSRREGLLSQVRYRIKRPRGVAGAAPQSSLVADP